LEVQIDPCVICNCLHPLMLARCTVPYTISTKTYTRKHTQESAAATVSYGLLVGIVKSESLGYKPLEVGLDLAAAKLLDYVCTPGLKKPPLE